MAEPGVATSVKVVVTGPFAAGKTTFISALSEIPLFSTEQPVTDVAKAVKGMTTVSMDWGKITFRLEGDEIVLYLFGTPGQDRFDFMWDVLARGMLGFIVLVDVTREDSLAEARKILEYFKGLAKVPYVVAANRATGDDEAVDSVRRQLGLSDDDTVVPCEAVSRQSAKEVLLALLYAVLAMLDESEPISAAT
jgi:uncharacterized protein